MSKPSSEAHLSSHSSHTQEREREKNSPAFKSLQNSKHLFTMMTSTPKSLLSILTAEPWYYGTTGVNSITFHKDGTGMVSLSCLFSLF